MPRELVAIAPRKPLLREYEEPPLAPDQVRMRSTFSAAKHGTELGLYRGDSPVLMRPTDPELGIFVPGEVRGTAFPMVLGNMTVGVVTEVGAEVQGFRVGDRAFGHMGFRETHTVAAHRLEHAPEGMSPEAIVCHDPAEFALGAVRDGRVRLGERVAVFGLGAIGLLVVQMAKLSGAEMVIAIDPIQLRRDLALRHGADRALDPRAEDAGATIRRATGGGVDVAIEASGAYPALHEAIRCAHFGGLVVPLAFYTGEGVGLRLGEEFHFGRATILSSRACSDPNRDHPMWDDARIRRVAFDLLREGKLSVEGLICPVVAFEHAAEAYREIDEHPERSVKLGITYD